MGLVSRSREWGLVAPRLMEGKYLLTTMGLALLEQMEHADRLPATGHSAW
jgi:hypothetical protein